MSISAVKPGNKPYIQTLLDDMAAWETPLLESFAEEVSEIIARRKSPNLSDAETELLKKINEGIPSAAMEKYNLLKAKQKNVGLTEWEQEDLDKIIDFIEKKEAELLSYLISLARLRKVSLNKLRKQLGVKSPPAYAW